MEHIEPRVISLDSVTPIPAEEAPTRVKIARLITRRECGSNLLLGACWMEPGEETNVWSFEENDSTSQDDHYYGTVDETYFVIRGHLQLTWNEGEADLHPNDGVFLAPGYTYHLKNVGDEPAFFIYGMAPSPE